MSQVLYDAFDRESRPISGRAVLCNVFIYRHHAFIIGDSGVIDINRYPFGCDMRPPAGLSRTNDNVGLMFLDRFLQNVSRFAENGRDFSAAMEMSPAVSP